MAFSPSKLRTDHTFTIFISLFLIHITDFYIVRNKIVYNMFMFILEK